MGRAISRDPSLFLFDEPLSNLDAKLRVEMRTEIKLLHKRMGTTIVYVTHDQIEAMTLSDQIAVMRAGEVQQFGTPQQVYDDPVNLFVAGFMGSPSMNFITAKVETLGSGCALRLQAGAETHLLPTLGADAALQAHVGQEVVFGIRPEQITHRPEWNEGPDLHTLELPVDLVEPTGPDTLLLVPINGQKVTCRVHPTHACAPGDRLALTFDLAKAVYFDPKTEQRLA